MNSIMKSRMPRQEQSLDKLRAAMVIVPKGCSTFYYQMVENRLSNTKQTRMVSSHR